MKKYFLTVFFLITIFMLPVYGQSIQVVTEEFPPYNYKENGKITGISTEVVQAILKKADINLKVMDINSILTLPMMILFMGSIMYS